MNWKMIVFAAAFVVGCGKKKEPESAATAGPQVESTVGLVEVNRKANPEGPDQRWINAPVELKNNLGGAITVNKIEWHIDVGGQDLGNNAKEFNEQVAAGATGKFLLSNTFTWSDDRPLAENKAHVTGTITWTGPKGNINTTALDVTGTIKDDAAANISKPEGQ